MTRESPCDTQNQRMTEQQSNKKSLYSISVCSIVTETLCGSCVCGFCKVLLSKAEIWGCFLSFVFLDLRMLPAHRLIASQCCLRLKGNAESNKWIT